MFLCVPVSFFACLRNCVRRRPCAFVRLCLCACMLVCACVCYVVCIGVCFVCVCISE